MRRVRVVKALPLLLLLAHAATLAMWVFVPPAGPVMRALRLVNVMDTQSGRHTAAQHVGNSAGKVPPALVGLLPHLGCAPALAASDTMEAGGDIAGAFVAYGHYLSLLLATACLVTERLIVKPNMTAEEETRMQVADSVYGAAGLLSIVTGYLRVTQYGKGWEFYQHEPIFWLKVSLVAVAGACSFFVTATILKRAFAQRDAGDARIAPVSEKLATRMTSIINAQLLAIGSIPLTATLMARGVGYAAWLPWQAGAAPAVLFLAVFGFRYVKEALDWTEDET